ncbi:GNAT family N-acetyltransferase [Arthrobacter sp. UYCu712]|uniref:GNAT family N-acetyltransferase n=1 Tax=Arthrobacter sp. UYCu712 TaxID=3156340 RepID=UPI00339635B3
MTEERARALWERALSTQYGAEDVTVATDAGTGAIAGVVRYGLEDPGHGIISSLYVDPASQGCGVGSRLLRGAESALTEEDVESASLWVFADNAASIAFYATHGWLPGSEPPARDREFGEPVYRLSKSFPDARPTPPPSGSEPGSRTADQPGAATAFAAGICP